MEFLVILCAYITLIYVIIGVVLCVSGLYIALIDFNGLLEVAKFHDPEVYGWLQENPLRWKTILVTVSLLAICFWIIYPLFFKRK